LCMTLPPGTARSQKYNFFNYEVEQGLAQSQAYGFCQDSLNRLWIATFGGLSRFDGTHFTNFNKADGLINDFATCVYHDHANQIWAGTQTGLSKYDGCHFYSFPLTAGPINEISAIAEDRDGTIWVVDNFKLFRIAGNKSFPIAIRGQMADLVTTLCADSKKRIWASIFKQGIFCLENGNWVRKIDLSERPQANAIVIRQIYFDHDDPDRIWIVHKTGLLYYNGHQLADRGKNYTLPPGDLMTMAIDPFGKFWLVTTVGLFRQSGNEFERLNADNGFTDDPVTNVFKDNENNLWVSTIGAGIWRYSFDPFTIFESPDGGEPSAVMGLVEEQAGRRWGRPFGRGTIWMGAYGKGLIRYDGHSLQGIKIPSSNANAQKILCLLPDTKGDLWIGTDNGGLWKLSKGQFLRMDSGANGLPAAVNHLIGDGEGGLWMSSSLGCLHWYADGKILHTGLWSMCTLPLGGDSVLVGTEQGLILIKAGKPAGKLIEDVLQSYPLQCMVSKGNSIYLGTQNKGLVIWNRRTGSCHVLNTKKGMSSDVIYSLLFDSEGNLWAGTGKGINEIRIDRGKDRYDVVNYAEAGSITSSECNQASIMEDGDKKIWFGTTRGAMRYDTRHVATRDVPARVELQEIRLQDHLTFSFHGITFKHANEILYHYKLEGLEENFSPWSAISSVVYPALPPGHYTFIVSAFIPGAGYSPNAERYSFEITGPFYRSSLFPYLVSLAMILSIGAVWLLAVRARKARKWRVEKIRRDEYDRVRQRTSEDFHDELGNKLTRITVLADILESRIEHRAEAVPLVAQIKSHVGSLYEGTREILWSLTPENDSLQGMIRHIREIGTELFHGTQVSFHFADNLENARAVSLNGEYSRNIIMIFKEAMNNILRHAGAQNAWLEVTPLPGQLVRFDLQDDGCGFDPQLHRKGYGIGNMKVRAGRIDADLQIGGARGLGTTLRLTVRTRTT
jgi:ligand-binding sensor domain-containing protein/signal transduction histidine kinase